MFVEQMLASRSKVKILRVLADVRRAYNLEALHKESGLSTGILSTVLRELTDAAILTRMKGRRKERLFSLNTSSQYAPTILQLFATEKVKDRKNVVALEVWCMLEHSIQKIKNKTELIILFGSHARGEATLESDIDLFVVYNVGIQPKILKDKLVKIDKRISAMAMSKEAFVSHVKEQTPLYLNLKKEGILLFISDQLKNSKEIKHFLDGFQQQ